MPGQDLSDMLKLSKYSKQTSEVGAFVIHIFHYVFMATKLVNITGETFAAWMTLFTTPIAIPAAILTSPIVFMVRGASFAKDSISSSIQNYIDERNKKVQTKELENIFSKHEFEVDEGLWQKALGQAERNLFLQNKKRLLIIGKKSSLRKLSVEQSKQFIAIIDEDKKVYDIEDHINRALKDSKAITFLMCKNKVLTPTTLIKDIEADDKGIIKLTYVNYETFG